METKEKSTKITETDFFKGLFATFASRNYKTVLFNKYFGEVTVKVFQEFTEYAKQRGAELNFRIQLHPLHGDSETIHRGILCAAQTGIISLDSPGRIIRIKLTKDEADAILDNITGGKLFIGFADRIIDIFSH
jgi:hypothetical protein